MGIWKNLIKFAVMRTTRASFTFFSKLCITIYLFQTLTGCAIIVPPNGGPRDSIPPYVIYAKPKDSTTNLTPKEIVIAFNEYITMTNIQENLLINPSLKNSPLIDAKLNAVQIKIKDSLAPNTTYRIQFGNAIRDVNEGNIAQDLSYVFSTGSQIDSGKIQGSVKIAETGKVDSTLIVVLHPAENDTAIFKNRPFYYTKLNGQGKFGFDYLPFKSYAIFAIPNDYTKKYDDSTKLFAFSDFPIKAGGNADSIQLFAFQAYEKNVKKKTIPNKSLKRNTANLKYLKNFDGKELDILHPLQLTFEVPVYLNDSFPIILADTFNNAFENFNVSIDSTHSNIVSINYPWTAGVPFHLLIPQKGVIDSLHNTLSKSDTLAFITKPISSYGSCLLRINGYEKFTNPILLLTQDDKILFKYPITQNLLNIAQLPPGDFQLKILADVNHNGNWDTGKYGYGNKNKQPEIIWLLPDRLKIKADWENEFNITINK